MRYANDAECKSVGLDPAEVERISRGLEKYAKQAQALGLIIFGGAGGGTLRIGDGGERRLVVAELRSVRISMAVTAASARTMKAYSEASKPHRSHSPPSRGLIQ